MKQLDLSDPEVRQRALEYEIQVARIKGEAQRAVRAERAQASTPRFGLSFDGAEDLRPAEYLVQDLIPVEGAGMLFGESNVGKTWVSVSLGVHVAAGKEWLGRDAKRGTVLFFEAEGGRAFALRKHAAKGAAGLGDKSRPLPFERLPFLTVYEPLGFGPNSDIAVAVANAGTIRAEVESKEMPPVRLVVVDTLSQNMTGDSDNNPEMQAFLRVFRAFLKALSAEPVFGLVIHHPGHENKGRGRGAYALGADLDLIMHLEGDPDALTLSCKRMRDDAPFAPVPLRLERRIVTVDGEVLRDRHGREQGSLVVVPRPTEGEKHQRTDAARDAVLAALPDYPDKVGIQSQLVPRVKSVLGSISKDTIAAKCHELEREGLAQSAPGRQSGSLVWGKAAPKPAAEEAP